MHTSMFSMFGSLPVDDHDGQVGIPTSLFKSLCTVFSCISKVALAVAHLKTLHFGTDGRKTHTPNFEIRLEVVNAFRMAVGSHGIARDLLLDPSLAAACDAAKLKLKFELPTLVSWLERAILVVRGLKVATVHGAVADVAAFAEMLSDKSPKIDTFINEKVYIKTQAKKQLLDWAHRPKFCDDAVSLFHAMSSLGGLPVHLSMQTKIEDHSGESYKYITTVFDTTKTVLNIIAYVNCVQGMSGAQQEEKARALYEKGSEGVPGPLFKAIEQLASKPAAKKRKSG